VEGGVNALEVGGKLGWGCMTPPLPAHMVVPLLEIGYWYADIDVFE